MSASSTTLLGTLSSADWYRALTLSERAELLRGSGRRLRPQGSSGPAPDSAFSEHAVAAEWRLRSWKAQSPFDQPRWLSERLVHVGLDEAALESLLGIHEAELRAARVDEPRWLVILREAFTRHPGGVGRPRPHLADALVLPDRIRRDPASRFLELFELLLEAARHRLREGMGGIGARSAGGRSGARARFEPAEIEPHLFGGLAERLLELCDRTLVLELNVARLRGELEGTTPEERFASFVARLRDPDVALAMLREYPVLARLAVETIERWLESSLELLGRLDRDWDDLCPLFGGVPPGRLVEARIDAGDAHRGGRAVSILGFASGARLVYKPRGLAMDRRFQELLSWLNQRGDHPPFRTLEVLDRGTHGWVEFVDAAPCDGPDAVERFCQRLGGLLAVLHAIGAVDFHFENLIAAGEQPVPVDLESLFHPDPPRRPLTRPDERLAARALGDSVLRVGLLPFRVGEGEDVPTVDLSGVAAVKGQLSPQKVLQWERAGSDEMHAARKRIPMAGGRNLPTLGGREVEVADHIEAVDAGFRQVYRLIVRQREALLGPEGPLARLASSRARAVLRPSRAYGVILDESRHPDFLRDALDRDRFLDRLWVGIEDVPELRRVVHDEHRDLWSGDIPYFEFDPRSMDLWASSGGRVAGFFTAPPLAAVERRIGAMGEDDLFRQAWLARVSLGTLLLNRDTGEWPDYAMEDPGEPSGPGAQRARLVRAAREVGEWFESMAISDGKDLTWVTLDLRNRVWSLFPGSEDLYAGVPGISLFLAYLAEVLGEARFARLAHDGLRTVLRRLEQGGAEIGPIGLFQGWGALAYALAHLGVLWGDAELLDEAEAMVERIGAALPGDRELDVVAGAAGAITALLALHRATGSERALEAARASGEHLLASARPSGAGLGWPTGPGGEDAGTGFAHGAAGIGTSLVRLAAAVGDERYRHAALAAFAFEREAIGPEVESETGAARPGEKGLAMSWCYGAPGLGLARLAALRLGDDATLRDELLRTLDLTRERGFGKNHCLCHGDLGNLDFVTEAGRFLGEARLDDEGRRLTRIVLASIERDGWRCGTVAGIEAPGLMNGLAGIGYGLLRLADPDRIPSVLLMEPPQPRATGAFAVSRARGGPR